MLKRSLLPLLLLVAMLAPALAIAGPAEAANRTPGCATKTEFRAAKKNQTIARVRQIIGAQGRTTSSSTYSDGDTYRSLSFRQCKRSWSNSYISISFESTETQVYVSGCSFGYYEGCSADGYYETDYVDPLIMTSKSAYWS